MRRNTANNRRSAVIEKIEQFTIAAPDRYSKEGWELFIHRPCGAVVINDHYEVYRQSDGKRGFFYLRRWYTNAEEILQGLIHSLVKLYTTLDTAEWYKICGDYTVEESYNYFVAHGDFYPTYNLPHLERRVSEYKSYIKDLYILTKVYFPRISWDKIYKAATDAAWDIIKNKYPKVAKRN